MVKVALSEPLILLRQLLPSLFVLRVCLIQSERVYVLLE